VSLANKTLSGFAWTLSSSAGKTVLIVGTGILLARLLTPADFGLVALLYVFFEISNSLVDSGLSAALIRKKDVTEEDRATVFFVNLAVAVFCYGLVWIGAPLLSAFFEQPQLTVLARVMGLCILFNSLTIVQLASLNHSLDFRSVAVVEVISNLVSGVVAVWLAWTGGGVWALVARYVILSIIASLLLWLINPWRPVSFIKRRSFDELFGFGAQLMVAGLVDRLANSAVTVLIGKLFSPAVLGLYSQAASQRNNVYHGLTTPLLKVAYPVLSKTQADQERLRTAYLKVTASISFVVVPAMVGLALVAKPLVHLVLGPQWLEMVPLLQLFAIAGIALYFIDTNQNLLKVLGRSDLCLRFRIYNKAGLLLAVLLGVPFGIQGVAIAVVVNAYVNAGVITVFAGRLAHLPLRKQLGEVLPILGVTVLMGGAVAAVQSTVGSANIVGLLAPVVAGAVTYAGVALLVRMGPAVMLISAVRTRLEV
jgi:O-antigen/teichoic acid export membrane protein